MQSHHNHQIQKIKLLSGAKLFNIVIPNYPISVVSAWFKAGSKFDPPKKEGLAHFFEHLLMTKTKKYTNRQARLKALESKGIFFNAFTTKELSYYYQVQLSDQIYTSLDLLIDGLENSQITGKDIEREKTIILNEESQNYSSPEDYIWRLNDQGLWSNSSLGKDLFGNKKTITSIGLNDVIDFKNKYYTASNLVFLVISSEPINLIKEHINKKYKPVINKTDSSIFDENFLGKIKKIVVDHRDLENTVMSINYRTTSADNFREIVALEFIKSFMANTWISRLVDTLRVQKNITYWVNGNSAYFSDRGRLGFQLSIEPKMIHKTIPIILKEIEQLKNKKISQEDLIIHKTSHKSNLIMNFTDPYEIMWWYGHIAALTDDILSIDKYIEILDSLSADDIRNVANKFLVKKNLSISFIGPTKEKDIKIKSL